MNELFMSAKNLIGNKNKIKKGYIELIRYNRPYIKGSVCEANVFNKNLRFGHAIIGQFSVVATIGNHIQGAIDWLTRAEIMDTLEIREDSMVNGESSISAKDIYCNVRIEALRILYSDSTRIPIVVYMSFHAQTFQLATVGFKDTTQVTATNKVGVLHHHRKIKK